MCPFDRFETYVIKPGTVFTFAPCNLTNEICGNAPQNSSFLATRNNPPEVATRHRLFWLQEFLTGVPYKKGGVLGEIWGLTFALNGLTKIKLCN